MFSGTFVKYLPELIKEGKVNIKTIDDAVKNVLRIKFRMGLFENPYFDEEARAKVYLTPEHLEKAKQTAVQSAILLKNENNTLPILGKKKIAIIGPLADQVHEQLGTWAWDGVRNATQTPIMAFKNNPDVEVIFEAGLQFSRDRDTKDFDKVKSVVNNADVAIVFLGEESILSGEAHSLANLDLVGAQSELLAAVKSVGKPVILVVMAGRPLTIEKNLPNADAVVYYFHPGTMGGPAIMDLVLGKENFSGKLPVTFVREVGQIPMYYNHNNTGRPAPDKLTALYDIPVRAPQTSLGNTSFYLDAGKMPLYPFGYGLSYAKFDYSNLILSTKQMAMNDVLTIKATITNSSKYDGTEVVQLYVQDVVGSIVRPVKELKGFQRVTLKAGESKVVEFKLNAGNLAFYGSNNKYEAEFGDFNIWVGTNSQEGLKDSFELK
jgi:beta-glucosidase